MQSRFRLVGLLAALATVLTFVGAVAGAVVLIAQDEGIYNRRDIVREATGLETQEALTAYIGMSAQEQEAFAREIASRMGDESLDFDGIGLNEREQQHMLDVRAIVLRMQSVAQLCLSAAAVLAVAASWAGAGRRQSRRAALGGVLWGVSALGVAAAALAAAVCVAGFERSFYFMHELLFDNDLWLLNPHTDMLIRIMPQLLFERTAIRLLGTAAALFALVLALLAATASVFGGVIRRMSDANRGDEPEGESR